MKRKLIFMAMMLIGTSTFAQEENSAKKETKKDLLPKAGDFGIGFDAAALIRTAGGLFWNNNDETYSSQRFANRVSGKYFLTDNTAIRVNLGFNSEYNTTYNQVLDAQAQYDATFGNQDDIEAAQNYLVEDQWKENITGLNISAGYEWRKGNRIIQGVFGGEAVFGLNMTKNTYAYGNTYSDLFEVDYTDASSWGNVLSQDPTTNETRVLETKSNSFTYGARAFAGIEVFVAPKISLGLEYGIGYYFTTSTNKGDVTENYYPNYQDGPTVIVEEAVNKTTNNTSSTFVTDNNGATAINAATSAVLTLMFHFN